MRSNPRTRWISLALAGGAVVLGVARAVTEPGRGVTIALVWLLSIAITAVICVGLVKRYNARMSRAVAVAPPGSWTATCVLPENPQTWRAVIADEARLSIVDRRGRTKSSWPWEQIADIHQASFLTGMVHHDGLRVMIKSGGDVGLLFPSRNTLAYPRDLLASARTEMQGRLRARVNSRE